MVDEEYDRLVLIEEAMKKLLEQRDTAKSNYNTELALRIERDIQITNLERDLNLLKNSKGILDTNYQRLELLTVLRKKKITDLEAEKTTLTQEKETAISSLQTAQGRYKAVVLHLGLPEGIFGGKTDYEKREAEKILDGKTLDEKVDEIIQKNKNEISSLEKTVKQQEKELNEANEIVVLWDRLEKVLSKPHWFNNPNTFANRIEGYESKISDLKSRTKPTYFTGSKSNKSPRYFSTLATIVIAFSAGYYINDNNNTNETDKPKVENTIGTLVRNETPDASMAQYEPDVKTKESKSDLGNLVDNNDDNVKTNSNGNSTQYRKENVEEDNPIMTYAKSGLNKMLNPEVKADLEGKIDERPPLTVEIKSSIPSSRNKTSCGEIPYFKNMGPYRCTSNKKKEGLKCLAVHLYQPNGKEDAHTKGLNYGCPRGQTCCEVKE